MSLVGGVGQDVGASVDVGGGVGATKPLKKVNLAIGFRGRKRRRGGGNVEKGAKPASMLRSTVEASWKTGRVNVPQKLPAADD